jgi:hypothetical protein
MNNDENMRIAQHRYDNMEKPDQEEPEMEKWTITLVIESDSDPGKILDESIEIGHRLAETMNGHFNEDDVCVSTYKP